MDAAVPGKCSGLQVSDITKNACRLRWKPPDDDGGSRVTHYVVERQEVGKPYWTTIATFAKVPTPPSHPSSVRRLRLTQQCIAIAVSPY